MSSNFDVLARDGTRTFYSVDQMTGYLLRDGMLPHTARTVSEAIHAEILRLGPARPVTTDDLRFITSQLRGGGLEKQIIQQVVSSTFVPAMEISPEHTDIVAQLCPTPTRALEDLTPLAAGPFSVPLLLLQFNAEVLAESDPDFARFFTAATRAALSACQRALKDDLEDYIGLCSESRLATHERLARVSASLHRAAVPDVEMSAAALGMLQTFNPQWLLPAGGVAAKKRGGADQKAGGKSKDKGATKGEATGAEDAKKSGTTTDDEDKKLGQTMLEKLARAFHSDFIDNPPGIKNWNMVGSLERREHLPNVARTGIHAAPPAIGLAAADWAAFERWMKAEEQLWGWPLYCYDPGGLEALKAIELTYLDQSIQALDAKRQSFEAFQEIKAKWVSPQDSQLTIDTPELYYLEIADGFDINYYVFKLMDPAIFGDDLEKKALDELGSQLQNQKQKTKDKAAGLIEQAAASAGQSVPLVGGAAGAAGKLAGQLVDKLVNLIADFLKDLMADHSFPTLIIAHETLMHEGKQPLSIVGLITPDSVKRNETKPFASLSVPDPANGNCAFRPSVVRHHPKKKDLQIRQWVGESLDPGVAPAVRQCLGEALAKHNKTTIVYWRKKAQQGFGVLVPIKEAASENPIASFLRGQGTYVVALRADVRPGDPDQSGDDGP